MESRIIKFKPLDDQSRLNMSHKVGDLELSFEKLIGTFGEPNFGSDGYKTDVEWGIEFDDGTLASIYNYKNGKNYNGQYGLDVEDIRHWSIGGFDKKSYNKVMDAVCDYLYISAKYGT